MRLPTQTNTVMPEQKDQKSQDWLLTEFEKACKRIHESQSYLRGPFIIVEKDLRVKTGTFLEIQSKF